MLFISNYLTSPRSEHGPAILVDVEFTEEVLVEAEVLEEEVLVHSPSWICAIIMLCSSICSVLDEAGFILWRWRWMAPPEFIIRADSRFGDEVLVEEVLVLMLRYLLMGYLLKMQWVILRSLSAV